MFVISFLSFGALMLNACQGLAPSIQQTTARNGMNFALLPTSSFVLRAASDGEEYVEDDSPSDVEDAENVFVNTESTVDDSVVEDDFPSDVEEETTMAVEEESSASAAETFATEEETTGLTESQVNENFLFLQSVAAMTGRGEKASEQQINAVREVVSQLEAANPTPEPANNKQLLQGTWELTFTDTKHLFRSSPFFMAARSTCQTQEQLEQFEWFCTMHRAALAVSQIGPVRQVISDTRLVSEFEVEAGAVPFLSDLTPFAYSGGMPVTIEGAIVSSADLTTLNATAYELYMDTVQIKGSNLPGLRQVLDNGLELQSRMLGDFLESNIDQYSNPRPVVRTTYLSPQFRISRDMDDHIYIYVKTSSSTEPKDYSDIESDLGIGKLVEGFNKAVTKFGL